MTQGFTPIQNKYSDGR